MLRKLACMLVDLMGIEIYDHCVVLLGLGLKESKITLNIMKVGMHSYLPNAHLNQSLNLNSKNLVKSETPSCNFDVVGLKGGKIARNVTKVGVHTCLSNMHPNL